MSTAYVSFGSNLGNRRRTVESALRALADADGVRLTAVSRLYETSPVGGPKGQRAFLNGVARVEFAGSSSALLSRLLAIERAHGRRRRVKWGPRTLDLDLLAYDDVCRRSPRLTLPHPRYHERRFVLRPFCDVAPRYIHPLLKTENRSFLKRLTSDERVTMIGTWKNSRFLPSVKRSSSARRSSR